MSEYYSSINFWCMRGYSQASPHASSYEVVGVVSQTDLFYCYNYDLIAEHISTMQLITQVSEILAFAYGI